MTLSVDIIHGCGPTNKVHRQLQPKETKVRLYSGYYNSKRCYTHRNKTQRFSFVVIPFLSKQKAHPRVAEFCRLGEKNLPKTSNFIVP